MRPFLASLALLALTTSLQPQAQAETLPTPEHYDCQIIVVAQDVPDGVVTTKFRAIGPQTESHGGTPYTFPFGENTITVLANARWRAIQWQRGKQSLAAATHVRASDSFDSEVLIANNVQADDESVTLECHPSEEKK